MIYKVNDVLIYKFNSNIFCIVIEKHKYFYTTYITYTNSKIEISNVNEHWSKFDSVLASVILKEHKRLKNV